MLRLCSSCAWFVGIRPNQIAAECRWRATEPFLCTIYVENPSCDMHVRARKDEGEDVLRKGILSSCLQFWRAVREKLFSEKLFSEPGCLREAVLEKPFSDWLFYESQQRSCSGRSCLTRSGSVRGRSGRSGSANGRDTPRTYSGGASAPPQRRCSYSLHTYWETRPHGQGSQLGINDHN